MAHVYCINYQHIVFRIKKTFLLTEDIHALHRYMEEYLRGLQVRDACVGGIYDHIHILGNIGTLHLPVMVRLCKTAAGRWLRKRNARYYQTFRWQVGYSSFATSYSLISKVKEYIGNQYVHHLKQGVKCELKQMLAKHGIAMETEDGEGEDAPD